MSKKTHGVLSVPEWAVESTKISRRLYEVEKGTPLSKTKIRNWSRTLREAVTIFHKVEPFLRSVGNTHSDTGRRRGAGYTENLLMEAAKFLEQLPASGKPVDIGIAKAVYGLANEYKKKTGTQNYRQVGEVIMDAFQDVLPRRITESDPAEWARKTATRYGKLLANEVAWHRVFNNFRRRQILHDQRAAGIRMRKLAGSDWGPA